MNVETKTSFRVLNNAVGEEEVFKLLEKLSQYMYIMDIASLSSKNVLEVTFSITDQLEIVSNMEDYFDLLSNDLDYIVETETVIQDIVKHKVSAQAKKFLF